MKEATPGGTHIADAVCCLVAIPFAAPALLPSYS